MLFDVIAYVAWILNYAIAKAGMFLNRNLLIMIFE